MWLTFAAGAILGFLVNPRLWPLVVVGYPVRYVALLAWNAIAESAGNPEAVGDVDNAAGRSVGLLQFHRPTADELTAGGGLTGYLLTRRDTMTGGDWRTSPFWSAFAAAKYISGALEMSARWYGYLAVPGLDGIAIRWMWTHGRGSVAGLEGAEPYGAVPDATWRLYPLHVVGGVMVASTLALLGRVAWWTRRLAVGALLVGLVGWSRYRSRGD